MEADTSPQGVLIGGHQRGSIAGVHQLLPAIPDHDVTLDTEDDELAGWSRDGASVFALQRGVDPGQRDRPVTRVYRYDL